MIVIGALLVSACAYQITGNKTGAGQAEFSNDFLECRMLSKRVDGEESRTTISTCMQGKGWTNVQTKTTLF